MSGYTLPKTKPIKPDQHGNYPARGFALNLAKDGNSVNLTVLDDKQRQLPLTVDAADVHALVFAAIMASQTLAEYRQQNGMPPIPGRDFRQGDIIPPIHFGMTWHGDANALSLKLGGTVITIPCPPEAAEQIGKGILDAVEKQRGAPPVQTLSTVGPYSKERLARLDDRSHSIRHISGSHSSIFFSFAKGRLTSGPFALCADSAP